MKKNGAALNRHRSRGDHATPVEFIAAVEGRFDLIELDLAATKKNAVMPRFISRRENSLKQDWTKMLGGKFGYLNPPFDPIDPWVEKAVQEALKGARFVMLTRASVDSNWFWRLFDYCCVYALSPRITFVGSSHVYPNALILSAFNCIGQGSTKREWNNITRWNWKNENIQR